MLMSAQTRDGWHGHPPPLQMAQIIECAQADAADRLCEAVGTGRMTRSRYQDWLALECAACRIAALSLDAVAGWHRNQADLHGTAVAWADELRMRVRLAATDVRRLDGMASALPAALGEWHAFLLQAGGSQRAGEVLGSAVLQAQMLDGRARQAVAAIVELPFARYADGYLSALLQPGPDEAVRDARESLLEAYSSAALIAGAQRGAEWLRAAFFATFAMQAH